MVSDDPRQVLVERQQVGPERFTQVSDVAVVVVDLVADHPQQLPRGREKYAEVGVPRRVEGFPELREEGDAEFLFRSFHQKFGQPVGQVGHIKPAGSTGKGRHSSRQSRSQGHVLVPVDVPFDEVVVSVCFNGFSGEKAEIPRQDGIHGGGMIGRERAGNADERTQPEGIFAFVLRKHRQDDDQEQG